MKYAELLYDDSEHGADMLYATGVKVPDPFIWMRWKGRSYVAVNKLEFDRVKRLAQVDEVILLESLRSPQAVNRGPEVYIQALCLLLGVQALEVPAQFPLGVFMGLKRRKVPVRIKKGSFFPERQRKSDEEVAKIRQALQLAETGLARGLEVLGRATVRKDRILHWTGQALTSERLRGEIDATIIREGGLPAGTIVAGGEQACDPHERGFGPLRADEAIILDIFPRDQRTGYFGDLTRTVVKSRPSEALQKLYGTVQEGQRWVMQQMKAGVDGAILHTALTKRFTEAGFPTEQKDGRWTGFFHGTGHGLGLEIHESPRFAAGRFTIGTAMTVEPGLYYPGLGGVRLEDLVIIRKDGVDNLTTAPFRLEV